MANRGFLNHIWYKLLDEEGVPIPSASVFIYEALNPTTQIVLYESDGLTRITQPLVTTSGGVFEFFVQDDIGVPVGASGHYPWDDEYLISWNDGIDKSGIIQGDALFGRFAQVNESPSAAINTRVNKAMSNYLGWVIQDHIDFQFGTTDRCGSSSSSSSSVSSSSESSSSSLSESASSSCSQQWIDVLGDVSTWIVENGTAGGSAIQSGTGNQLIASVGAGNLSDEWYTQKIRLQLFSSGTVIDSIEVRDSALNVLVTDTNLDMSAGGLIYFEYDVSWGANDLGGITIEGGSDPCGLFQFEFWEDCGSSSSKSSSSESSALPA